jgi:hypothetical protein
MILDHLQGGHAETQVEAGADSESRMLLKTISGGASLQPIMQPRHRTVADRDTQPQPPLAMRRPPACDPPSTCKRLASGSNPLTSPSSTAESLAADPVLATVRAADVRP